MEPFCGHLTGSSPRLRWCQGVLFFLLLAPAAADPANESASPELVQVRTLIRANVLGLAESILENQAPPPVPNGAWLNWERQLWALYRVTGQWRQLIDRVQAIPPAFPTSIHEEAERIASEAHLALGEGDQARQILRRHLLSPTVSEYSKIQLRRRIIDSYLREERLDDAITAVRIFQSDYRPQDRDWLLLAGSIALQSGNPSEVVRLLSALDDPEARILILRARFEEKEAPYRDLMERGTRMLGDPRYRQWKKPLLAVMVKAAETQGLLRARVDFLEQYLMEQEPSPAEIRPGIPRYDASDLVEGYSDLSATFPTFMELVQEVPPSWNRLSLRVNGEDDLTRRSCWAELVVDHRDPVLRLQAMDQWTQAAISADRWKLVSLLFGEGAPMGALRLTPQTGLQLSYKALEVGDYQLAADAIATDVSVLPLQPSPEDWFLYTARVFIIAGRYQEGIERLRQFIRLPVRLSSGQVDRGLQVIFLLQEAQRHESALALLDLIHFRSPGGKFDREIPFWEAESLEAIGQYREAAQQFLTSALKHQDGFDEWGRSARFRAAEALLKGHFFDDARALILDLLDRAEAPESAAELHRKLQQIGLREVSVTGQTDRFRESQDSPD